MAKIKVSDYIPKSSKNTSIESYNKSLENGPHK